MDNKFRDKCKKWKNEPLIINNKFNFKNVFFLLISVVMFLVTICGGYNFMTEVNLVISSFVALFIFIQILFKNKLNIYTLASYGILVFGTAFTFIVRGADGFWYRFGYNFGLSLLAIIAVTILCCIPKLKNHKVTYYVSRATSFIMIGASLIYFLFSNIRIKPTCVSLQDGHDEYLNNVRNSRNNTGDPNVLLILMDDMAYSDISSYSYRNLEGKEPTINTPNLDSIGESGIMMDNCYAASPVSSPSRFSILTGRYSCRGYLDNVVFNTKQQNVPFSQTRFYNPFQLAHNVDGLLGDEITIAEALQADGYKTGLFGKWNLGDYGEYLPTNQGFDYFYGSHYINDMIPYNVVEEEKGVFEEVYSHNDLLDQSLSTDRFTGKLMDYMKDQVTEGNKFFIEYASPWPHYPIFSNNNGNGEGDRSDDNYIDCIEEFDKAIGEILTYLRETDDPRNPGEKLYDNTLIMFTSDNGPGREGVTGSLRGRKNTPFEGAYKVPFLASYPNGFHHIDKHLQSRCMNFDILPTVLHYANIELPTDRVIDGISLHEIWEGVHDNNLHDRIYYLKGGKARAISGEFESYTGETDSLGHKVTAKQDFKYYENVQTENAAFFNQFYKDYLFNLDLDQAEGYNIAMRDDIALTRMTDEDRAQKRVINPIAKQLKEDLDKFNKEIKDDTTRRGKLS